MTEIIGFPKSRIVRENMNEDYIKKAKETGLQNFCEAILHDLTEGIIYELENYGIDTSSEKFIEDFSFAIEALRASVYRVVKIDHTLHEFLDNNVKLKSSMNASDDVDDH